MRQHSISGRGALIIISVVLSITPTNVATNDVYLRGDSDEKQHDIRNQDPFLVPIKEWFQKISDPLSKCVESEDESQKGWYLQYNNVIIMTSFVRYNL